MKKYSIKVNYDSADSFDQYPDQECIIKEVSWDNLEIAKENLKRQSERIMGYCSANGWIVKENIHNVESDNEMKIEF